MALRDSRAWPHAIGLAALITAGACAAVVAGSAPAGAQVQQSATASTASILDPVVAAALRRMSAALVAAPDLTVQFSALREVRLQPGSDQLIALGATVAVGIRRPDRLAALVGSDRGSFRLWYDGETATLLSLTANAFARVPMPGDIDEALDALEARLGVDVPVRDVLAANPYAALTEAGTTGVHVGRTIVNGLLCDQYALRNGSVDWQIWIAADEPALPCRLTIVDRAAAGEPRAILEFQDWNLAPHLGDETFIFTAPADAQELTWLERPTLVGPATGIR
ncbi:DUF2092 domain-containing protein [Falsiroseomonas sp. E2-1-a20]|uniref:DUF2092 domain-containing protein n=1 Tax=Falsiroseomonas sp. E2-1-a20 TaxID=3239300 RepID=UPI003F2A6D53